MTDEIYVLDAAVFIKNATSWFNDKICVTSYLVYEEMLSLQARMEFERMQLQNIQFYVPSDKSRRQVAKKAKGLKLSKTDLEILAIAYELFKRDKKVIVVTDDYWIQNVAMSLGIGYKGVERNEISKTLKWKKICESCKHEQEEGDRCERCGSQIVWVPII